MHGISSVESRLEPATTLWSQVWFVGLSGASLCLYMLRLWALGDSLKFFQLKKELTLALYEVLDDLREDLFDLVVEPQQ